MPKALFRLITTLGIGRNLGVECLAMGSREGGKLKRQIRILMLLTQKGPLNKYHICKELMPAHGTEPTILQAVSDLERQKLIDVIHVDEDARGSKPSKHYDLSLQGLLAFMEGVLRGPNASSRMRHLAEKYHNLLPGLFDLWPSIVQTGIEELACRKLEAVHSVAFLDIWDYPEMVPDSDELAEYVEDFLLGSYLEQDVHKQWMELLGKDKVLRYAVNIAALNRTARLVQELTRSLQLMPYEEIELTPEARLMFIGLDAQLQTLATTTRRIYGIPEDVRPH